MHITATFSSFPDHSQPCPEAIPLFRERRKAPRGPNRKNSPHESPDDANAVVSDEIHLLCRMCRSKVTRASARIRIHGEHRHTFFNPYGYVFEVGCFATAPGCMCVGKPTGEFTWFAGHSWQVAVCRGCQAHLGWRYIADGGGFYGLILATLIEESAGE